MFEVEKLEDGTTIEWDYPKPDRPLIVRQNSSVWWKRLSCFRSQPGRRGRVLRDIESSKQAVSAKANIERGLYGHDPHHKWKIESGREDDGTFSVWVTYLGVMSEDEFLEREKLRAERGSEVKKRKRTKQIRESEQLRRSILSATVRPPVYRGD